MASSIRIRPHHATRQRGAATLLVALILLGIMLIVFAAANRNLLLEWRMAANQAQSTAAFEAAEAGLEWATALLNAPARLGPDCRADTGAADSFRDRHLRSDGANFVPRSWTSAGTTAPLHPACVHGPTGWTCHCPAAADADLASASGPATDAAFSLQFLDAGRPGVVRLVSTGCNRSAGDCRPGSATRSEATARTEVLLALQAALPFPPAAALTERVATTSSDAFFVSHFALSKTAWRSQPGVRTLECRGDCGGALAEAIGAGILQPLVWVEGDLSLQGPLTLGTSERPVLVIASGAIRLRGAVSVHGVLYGNGIAWSGSGTVVRGALLSEAAASGDTSLDLARDASVLETLQLRTGALVRVPGSWRDF